MNGFVHTYVRERERERRRERERETVKDDERNKDQTIESNDSLLSMSSDEAFGRRDALVDGAAKAFWRVVVRVEIDDCLGTKANPDANGNARRMVAIIFMVRVCMSGWVGGIGLCCCNLMRRDGMGRFSCLLVVDRWKRRKSFSSSLLLLMRMSLLFLRLTVLLLQRSTPLSLALSLSVSRCLSCCLSRSRFLPVGFLTTETTTTR